MPALALLVVTLLAVGCGSGAVPTPTTVSTTPAVTPSPTPDATQTPAPDPNASPTPTPIDVLPYLTSEVTVVNLAASAISVTVTLMDTASDSSYEVGTFAVQPEQTTSQLIVPTRFRLEFAIDGDEVATCTIDVGEEEQLQFAVVETGAVITSNGDEPADPAEMVVATSSRCRAGEDG